MLLLVAAAMSASAEFVPGTSCGATQRVCLRGAGNATLVRHSPEDRESATTAACCDACVAAEGRGCVGWQLVNKSGAGPQACWLMAVVKPKGAGGADTCRSGKVSPPPAPPNQAALIRGNRTRFSGVWYQNGHEGDVINTSFVVGGDFAIPWSEVEVADGVWDWSTMDATFAAAAAQGFFIETALMVGNAAPSWIYNRTGGNASVPLVLVPTDQKGGKLVAFPYYLDATYQHLFLRAIDTFAAHIAAYPPHIRGRVVAAQAMYGSTGDDTPWHCAGKEHDSCPGIPAKYRIPDAAWHAWTMSTVKAVCQMYNQRGLKVLWNTNATYTAVQIHECPGSFMKYGSISHGFQLTDEIDKMTGNLCHTPGMHCRGESWPFMVSGYHEQAPLWATYTHLMWQLTFGLDMPGLTTRSLVNKSYAPLYGMFNKYATTVRPPAANWTGAIIALRDGLDANDTVRFPESKYGAGKQKNVARYLAIANDPPFKQRGAVEADPVRASSCGMQSRYRNGTNDVGWRIWTGNYGNELITQLDPQATSVGYWNVGPQDQPYGLFARGFEHASGRTTMAFTLDQRLWGGLPRTTPSFAPAALALVVRCVYFDDAGAAGDVGGVASFDVRYDSASGCKTLATVKTAGTGRWVTLERTVHDAAFGRGCDARPASGGADITLTSTSDADAIVHGLEIFRTSDVDV